jgi:hypothetical protein
MGLPTLSKTEAQGKQIVGLVEKNGITIKEACRRLGVHYDSGRRCVHDYKGSGKAPTLEPERPKPYRPIAPEVLLRAAIFDIETTGFRAGGYKGHLVLASILPLGSKKTTTVVLPFEERTDDRNMLLLLLEELWQYDILIHQNGADYDLNFLNTRRMFHGMPTLRTWMYFDTYQTARVIAPKIGKSLESMGYFFQSEGTKTKIGQLLDNLPTPYRDEHEEIIKDMRYHCEEDVKITRDVFNALFVEAMTVGTNQFKVTKWKRGVPSFDAWLMEYHLALADGKKANGNGHKSRKGKGS